MLSNPCDMILPSLTNPIGLVKWSSGLRKHLSRILKSTVARLGYYAPPIEIAGLSYFLPLVGASMI